MVVLDSENVYFLLNGQSLTAVYEVYRRVQVFNKIGFEYATVKLPYYAGYSTQSITELQAQTINADENGKVRITKLKDNAILDEVISDEISQKKFAFADVQDGSIIEYRYLFTARSFWQLNDWIFQCEIPELRSAIQLKASDYLHYTPTPQGAVHISEYKNDGVMSHYVMKNVPALKSEAYVTTMADYAARMTFPLKSMTLPYQKVKSFGESWDVVAQEIMKSKSFGEHLNELLGDQFSAAKEITKDLTSKEAKAKAIYALLTKKMKWNDKFNLYSSQRLSKSYADGTGNSGEINLLLIGMLRAVGIKSDPVLISTRGHGLIQRAYPRIRQFNNVIAVVELDSSTVFLDAAGQNRPFGQINVHNLNSSGLRIIKNDNSNESDDGAYKTVWMDIAPAKGSAVTVMSTMEIDANGNIKTKAVLSASEYLAASYREELNKDSVKACLKKRLKMADDFDQKNEKVDNLGDVDKKLKISIELDKKDSSADEAMLYVNPFPIKFLADNPLKMNERTYPVDFGYPFQQNIMTTLVLPPNYKVSELPKPMNVKLSDGSASFSFLIGQTDNNIQINTSLKLYSSQYQPDRYTDLKTLYEKMINAYSSLIVLEKSK